jgi:hypothetical protein
MRITIFTWRDRARFMILMTSLDLALPRKDERNGCTPTMQASLQHLRYRRGWEYLYDFRELREMGEDNWRNGYFRDFFRVKMG